ncbi:hypothetical protein NP233_g12471 [Leucocoprinus birnbaumii]|uniref:Uncharacterized protein n=1 Tax=Leucocoprinus birnbaumii TaxID=56174 RepID=A0AAD5YQ01_9AGAR|nr:hypothetical protein NP233_g12471 [Leucocoprinus birnbaumii]
MRSFAAIATFATLAFSAVASAVPAYGPSGSQPPHHGNDGGHHYEPGTGVTPHPPVGVPHPHPPAGGPHPHPPAGGPHPHYGRDLVVSIPELIVNVNAEIGPKCHALGDEIKKGWRHQGCCRYRSQGSR